MQDVDVSATISADIAVDLLAVPVLEPASDLTGPARELDTRLQGILSRAAADGEFTGRFNSALVVHTSGQLPARRVALAGLGPAERLDADAFRTAGGAVARRAREFGASIGWLVDPALALPTEDQAGALVEGTLLGAYDPGLYKTDGARPGIGRVVVIGAGLEETVGRAARISG